MCHNLTPGPSRISRCSRGPWVHPKRAEKAGFLAVQVHLNRAGRSGISRSSCGPCVHLKRAEMKGWISLCSGPPKQGPGEPDFAMFTWSMGPPEEGRKGRISRCSGPPKQGRESRISRCSRCPWVHPNRGGRAGFRDVHVHLNRAERAGFRDVQAVPKSTLRWPKGADFSLFRST